MGAVALDHKGRLAAATSTGGCGFEMPCRVSDSATVAGNYANDSCAVSVTGIGEQIVEEAVAASLCALVESGEPLDQAAHKLLIRAKKRRAQFGLISVSSDGTTVASTLTSRLTYAIASTRGFQVHP